jgi:hypothetical protein|tara:strand:+ start:533 stop:640 length:108 start_codon:yes stop_codon:yes gene_type:complete
MFEGIKGVLNAIETAFPDKEVPKMNLEEFKKEWLG